MLLDVENLLKTIPISCAGLIVGIIQFWKEVVPNEKSLKEQIHLLKNVIFVKRIEVVKSFIKVTTGIPDEQPEQCNDPYEEYIRNVYKWEEYELKLKIISDNLRKCRNFLLFSTIFQVVLILIFFAKPNFCIFIIGTILLLLQIGFWVFGQKENDELQAIHDNQDFMESKKC